MSKRQSSAKRKFLVKKAGIPAHKMTIHDQCGNKLGITPVFSPTLALLLCTVHRQNILSVEALPDISFTSFATNKIVLNAVDLWHHAVKECSEGEKINLEHALLYYLREIADEKNLKKVDRAMDIIMCIRKHIEASVADD